MSREQELQWMRELLASRAAELMRRYGAHSLGIGRLDPGADQDDRVALLFYTDPARSAAAEPLPPLLEYVPGDRTEPVELLTRVVESAPADFE